MREGGARKSMLTCASCSVNDGFDPSMTSGANNPGVNLSMTSMGGPAGNIYDMSPYSSFPSNPTAQQMGHLQSAAHLGGPQSMPFPAGAGSVQSSLTSMPTSGAGNASSQMVKAETDKSQFDPSLFSGEHSFGPFGGIDLSSMDGMNNPFGSMAGGYTMLSDGPNGGPGAQPTPIPGRNNSQQMGSGSGSGGRVTPSGASSSFSANFIGGPSPADSTGSTSAFFAYTPAMMAADAAMGSTQTQGSALGPVGGEGSKKKKEGVSELHLPPSAQSGEAAKTSTTNDFNHGHSKQ